MRWLAVALLLLAVPVFAQTAEESMYWELFSVLSYLGVLLLSFLFTLIAAIPFIDEVLGKKEIEAAYGPIANRRIWMMEAIVGLFLISMTISPGGRRYFEDAEVIAYVIAAICALLPFAIFAAMAFISNIYRKNLLKNVFSLMLWGVFAGACALFANQTLEGWIKPLAGAAMGGAIFTILAAFSEEVLKSIGLAEFMRKKGITPVLGILYGFAIGVGFSLLENWLYFSYGTTPYSVGVQGWTQILFYRSFFTTMAHGFFTAFNAYFVCRMAGNKYRFGIGLLVAFVLHILYNAAVLSKIGLLGPFMVLGLAFVFLFVAYSGMNGKNQGTGNVRKPRK
ncbi:MAG: PrsW family glutamic-type intramembrane protease [Candidatus Micrarchaeota archaeon]